tara:strand:- start:230 stop:496 length:267 start_codon:yes stop_codon:yes gene_type:complete
MIVKARALGAIFREVISARTHCVEVFDYLQSLSHGTHRRIRAKVPTLVVCNVAGHVDTRKWFAHRNLNVRVLLVVSEQNVKPWAMLFD